MGSRKHMGHVSESQNNCAQHKIYKHLCINSEEHQFTCDVCKKCCKWCSSLKIHVRTAIGECLFKCDMCKKAFSQRCDLQNHLHIHTGEWPFSCDVCKKSFNRIGSLKVCCTLTQGSEHLCVIYERKLSLGQVP